MAAGGAKDGHGNTLGCPLVMALVSPAVLPSNGLPADSRGVLIESES